MKMTKTEWLAMETRLDRVRRVAEELTANLQAPIDPLSVAKPEGQLLRCRGGDFRDAFDGQLEYHPSARCFVMFFNTKYDTGLAPGAHHPRTRFSISHELGHYFLEKHRAILLKGGKPHPSRGEFVHDVNLEREADAFAAGLLLPSRLARPLINEDELSLDAVEQLARHFNTSLVSTALRCVQLSDFPCAVVGLREGTVAWSVRSPSLVEAGLYPPERGNQGSRTAAGQWAAFASGAGERAQGSAFAPQWFRTFDRDDLAHVHVTEHYLPVKTMGTLLVLLTVPEDDVMRDDENESEDDDR